MILYGGSGHAKVIFDCLDARGITVLGVFDDNPNLRTFQNMPFLGAYNPQVLEKEKVIIAIGNNRIRQTLSQRITHSFGTVVHPSAEVSRFVKGIGDGTVIFHRAVVQADTYVGEHCIINTASSVDHDCILEDFVHISPNATLCGGVRVGKGTHIGASATVIPGVRIGDWCVIGAGAVVTQDIPDFSVAVGVPARVIRSIGNTATKE
ncbi:acetyltransferase [Cytophagaceae bacterium YF14B1]|uniref:Acetyltransferase n=1 Tax=Xanthocytophaga flava TaxID=3048013 RepID=A0AAE3QWY7_9BACT|nr:acetyltransferase [Xanthocytophaga flavus]MDJ1484299.1 acetyltransferase [Xanthocytophaga flavus]